jgi:hypothetical protein
MSDPKSGEHRGTTTEPHSSTTQGEGSITPNSKAVSILSFPTELNTFLATHDGLEETFHNRNPKTLGEAIDKAQTPLARDLDDTHSEFQKSPDQELTLEQKWEHNVPWFYQVEFWIKHGEYQKARDILIQNKNNTFIPREVLNTLIENLAEYQKTLREKQDAAASGAQKELISKNVRVNEKLVAALENIEEHLNTIDFNEKFIELMKKEFQIVLSTSEKRSEFQKDLEQLPDRYGQYQVLWELLKVQQGTPAETLQRRVAHLTGRQLQEIGPKAQVLIKKMYSKKLDGKEWAKTHIVDIQLKHLQKTIDAILSTRNKMGVDLDALPPS